MIESKFMIKAGNFFFHFDYGILEFLWQFSNIQFNDLVSHDQVIHGLSHPVNFEDNILKKKWGRYMDG